MVYPLEATVFDAEHGPSERTCAWRTYLHHNAHNHPEPVDTSCSTTATITPIGCNGETYYYRVVLTVTDAAGLSGSDEVLFVPDCGGFSGDFEGDISTWTRSGLWHRVVAGGPCGDSRGGAYSMYYGASESCTYDVGNTTGSLSSPPVTIDPASSPKLSFHHRFQTESFAEGAYDKLLVEIHDGSAWSVLQQWDSRLPNLDEWTLQDYDLAAYRGKTVRVRFRFDSVDDQFNGYAGWYVDDVLFTNISDAPQPPKAEFSASPRSGVGPLQVQFTDLSADTPTGWAWDFDADGSVDSVAQNPLHTYAEPGTYDVRLAVTNEQGSSVETKTGYVFVAPKARDWFDDMESAGTSWSATGLWNHMVGPGGCGIGALSGAANWHFGRTDTCDYDIGGRATGTLTSPPLLLGAGPASLTFFHRFETESFPEPFDRCLVEIDSGTGWQLLREWNSADDNVEAWTPVLIDIAAHAGKTVRIRFRFDSVDELFNAFEGWSIDDVMVTNVLAP